MFPEVAIATCGAVTKTNPPKSLWAQSDTNCYSTRRGSFFFLDVIMYSFSWFWLGAVSGDNFRYVPLIR